MVHMGPLMGNPYGKLQNKIFFFLKEKNRKSIKSALPVLRVSVFSWNFGFICTYVKCVTLENLH